MISPLSPRSSIREALVVVLLSVLINFSPSQQTLLSFVKVVFTNPPSLAASHHKMFLDALWQLGVFIGWVLVILYCVYWSLKSMSSKKINGNDYEAVKTRQEWLMTWALLIIGRWCVSIVGQSIPLVFVVYFAGRCHKGVRNTTPTGITPRTPKSNQGRVGSPLWLFENFFQPLHLSYRGRVEGTILLLLAFFVSKLIIVTSFISLLTLKAALLISESAGTSVDVTSLTAAYDLHLDRTQALSKSFHESDKAEVT
eukprot:TRINITY_DN6342_c1_g1_i1.p1 TRINITY_DN6342_c1_g1~~TRINITY_DN6342_c1_g1_i1.p1  ORF type:complete len:255 (+),score=19.72 TRINITY_DN6342_c1_g1_i1:649-1413(+)